MITPNVVARSMIFRLLCSVPSSSLYLFLEPFRVKVSRSNKTAPMWDSWLFSRAFSVVNGLDLMPAAFSLSMRYCLLSV